MLDGWGREGEDPKADMYGSHDDDGGDGDDDGRHLAAVVVGMMAMEEKGLALHGCCT